MKPLLVAAMCLGVSACGVVYHSPAVPTGNDSGSKVRVLALTAESALVANQSPYTPKSLPSVFFTTAGGSVGEPTIAFAPPSPTDSESRPDAVRRILPPPVIASPYEIGVGDVLVLATPSGQSTVAELSGLLAAQNRRNGYTVQDDGAIAIPDVGRVDVAGLTLDQAEAELFQSLVGAQIDPTFSLEVAEFNSRRVSIGGAVARPGVVSIGLTPLFLDAAIARSGGIQAGDLDFASIRLYRAGQLYQIPARDLYDGSAVSVQLVAGDSLFVDTEYELGQAQTYFSEQIRVAEFNRAARAQAIGELRAAINLRRAELNEQRSLYQARTRLGAVERDRVYTVGEITGGTHLLPLGQKATLAQVLLEKGFNNRTANPRQIYVLRGSSDPREFDAVDAWRLDARNASAFLAATRFEMRPNDVIFVAEQPVTRWNRTISQITPSILNRGINAITN